MPGATPSNPLLPHLADGAVLTSAELLRRMEATGLSAGNARQILRRHSNNGEVWRSGDLRLARNERLFASRSVCVVPSAPFYRAVGDKLATLNRAGISRCLQALAQHPVVPKADVLRLLAVSPEDSERRSYRKELAALREVGVRVVHPNTPLECIASDHSYPYDPEPDDLAAHAAARTRRAAVFARVLMEQLRRSNTITWHVVECASVSTPFITFNKHVFSGRGFSYLAPLQRPGKGKPVPTPVVIDVFSGTGGMGHVASLLTRIDRVANRGKSKMPVLGVIAAPGFTHDAWQFARRHGLMTIDLRQTCGEAALNAMVLAEELVRDVGHVDRDDSMEEFAQLLQDLKTNPVVVDLRSIAFEVLAGYILRSLPCDDVQVGVDVPWKDRSRDVDVMAWQGDRLWIVECKSAPRSQSLAREDVTKFFTETVPAAKKFVRDSGRPFKVCHAHIWTTGAKGETANGRLRELSVPPGDEWCIRNYDHVRESIPQRAGMKRLRKLLDTIAFEEGSGSPRSADMAEEGGGKPNAEQEQAEAQMGIQDLIPF